MLSPYELVAQTSAELKRNLRSEKQLNDQLGGSLTLFIYWSTALFRLHIYIFLLFSVTNWR